MSNIWRACYGYSCASVGHTQFHCFFSPASPPLFHNSKWEKLERMLHNNFERCLRVALVCSATNHYTFLCALISEFISKLPHGISDADSAECCRFLFTFFPFVECSNGRVLKGHRVEHEIAKLESINNNNGIFERNNK